MSKIMFLHGCYLASRSRSKVRSKSKVGVKVKGRGHVKISGVHNRGLALPSAAKSNKSHYQYKVFV